MSSSNSAWSEPPPTSSTPVCSTCSSTGRLWTYRGRTRENATREAILFFFANACGIGITQFCLLFTHHILGYTSALADNIAAYVVGFALGTAFRFFFYHYVVFTGHTRA